LPLDPTYLATAIEAALAAGRIHRQYFRQNPEVQKKGPIDLVTAADLAAEREFRALISRRFPDHSVGRGKASGAPAVSPTRCRWIVDPLDGTTNFALDWRSSVCPSLRSRRYVERRGLRQLRTSSYR
jgi:myo-inositol-1(or 4)-monophosphatase